MCRAQRAGTLAAMTEPHRSPRLSRRALVRGTGAAAALSAAGLPLSSCTTGQPRATAPSVPAPQPSGTGGGNVRVSNGAYGVHVEPSVAVNPANSRQLLAACQVSPGADPEFVAAYLSSDAGATWHIGGPLALPRDSARTADDVTVAFDARGRGYACATTNGVGRQVYVWRTDDGGRTFSTPVTVASDERCDHPWLAVAAEQPGARPEVYVVWITTD